MNEVLIDVQGKLKPKHMQTFIELVKSAELQHAEILVEGKAASVHEIKNENDVETFFTAEDNYDNSTVIYFTCETVHDSMTLIFNGADLHWWKQPNYFDKMFKKQSAAPKQQKQKLSSSMSETKMYYVAAALKDTSAEFNKIYDIETIQGDKKSILNFINKQHGVKMVRGLGKAIPVFDLEYSGEHNGNHRLNRWKTFDELVKEGVLIV